MKRIAMKCFPTNSNAQAFCPQNCANILSINAATLRGWLEVEPVYPRWRGSRLVAFSEKRRHEQRDMRIYLVPVSTPLARALGTDEHVP